jgi:hypothetical protein
MFLFFLVKLARALARVEYLLINYVYLILVLNKSKTTNC